MNKLSAIEALLKQTTLLYPELLCVSHLSAEQLPKLSEQINISVDELIPHGLKNDLREEEFFPAGDDVVVMRHIRYLPPVLHRHHFFELIYVKKGSCGNYIDGQLISLEPGDLCILSPKREHAISVFSDDAEIWNILIRTSTFDTTFFGVISDKDVLSAFFMQSLYAAEGRSYLLFRTGNARDPELMQVLNLLLKESEGRKSYRSRMLDSLLSVMFVLLLRNHEKDIVLPAGEADHKDNPMVILSYIQKNYAHLTLQELASHFGYSVRHTARLLKESTGQNFGEIIRDLKLHKAAELLTNRDSSIPDVMEAVGYSDVSAFYRAFKTYYGMNPATYRKDHIG